MNQKEKNVECELIPYEDYIVQDRFDFNGIIYDLDSQIELLSNKADKLDYLVAIASGIACGLLDILWVGEFDLSRGRDIADRKVKSFVKKTAEKLEGKEFKDLKSAVTALEKRFPIPSDGNDSHFGGALQHHLRDFSHHPTIIGMIFSLLTQFTEKSYGTDKDGIFIVVDVPEKSKKFIGKNVPEKISMGTITWFFHLVSDMAGSSSTVMTTGGTGIPGPILSLAKEISALPFFKDIKVNGDTSLSLFLSKLFNGTLFMKRDENGKILKDSVIKFDMRAELGIVEELFRQAIPVIANECIVRVFYLIRRFAMEMKEKNIKSIDDMKKIEWNVVKPINNATIVRMLTISTAVFTSIDVGQAIISQKYWLSINYVGVGRFMVAIGSDVSVGLKKRNVKNIRNIYENLRQNIFLKIDADIYKKIGEDIGLEMNKFGLTLEQLEILYNIEYYKTINDINNTYILIIGKNIRDLKFEWLKEWKKLISEGFESFIQVKGAKMHWYTIDELYSKIKQNCPKKHWYRLVLLEAMIFEPYFPLGTEKNKKGESIPSKKYKSLNLPANKFNKKKGDYFLNNKFTGKYCETNYIKRLRNTYDNMVRELSNISKRLIDVLIFTSIIAIITITTAGTFTGPMALTLIGTNFAGLSGVALKSAFLAYFGSGAISGAVLGGEIIAIIGGGAALGVAAGGTIFFSPIIDKKITIINSAKLLTSIKEIFLNDEKDIEFSNKIYEQYVDNIIKLENDLLELKLKKSVAGKKVKNNISEKIKKTDETVEVMKIANKIISKFNSSF